MDIDRPPRSPGRRRRHGSGPGPPVGVGFRVVPDLVPGGQDAWAPRPPPIDEPGGWAGAALAADIGCPFVLEERNTRPSLARAAPPPPPAASVPMIAAGSVYVLVDGLGSGGGGDDDAAPALDDFPGAVRLVERLLLNNNSGGSSAGPSIGPGGRCADTGLLAFYASPDAAEEAAARGLAAELVGGDTSAHPPPPPLLPPPNPLGRPSASTPSLITNKASVLRPPTDALQRKHWGGRAAAAAWEAAARAATAERVAAAAMRAAVAARGVRPGDADAATRRPPSIVAIPLGVAMEAMTAGERAWATLTPRPPAWPGERGKDGEGAAEKRQWWAFGRRRPDNERADGPVRSAPPASAPAYALPCTCVLIDTPAGPCGFIPTFLDVGVLRRTWSTYVEASARWWLMHRSLERGQWRAGVEAGAVAAFGTGGKLVSGGRGGAGVPDDDGDDEASPPKPPGRGGIRDKDEDPPEVKEMEAALRAAVASAMGGGAGGPPPSARGAGGNNRRGGSGGRPPPWAGAPRPIQAVLALAAMALTGAVCAAARAAEAAGDLVDEMLIRTPVIGPAAAGLPSTKPVVVETTLSSAARATSFFNGMNARIVGAGVAAGRWPPPPMAWQGVALPPRPLPQAGGNDRRPRRLAVPSDPSVSALAAPVTGGGGTPAPPPPPPRLPPEDADKAAQTASALIASLLSPPASWSPPPWDAVIGAVMQGVDYMVDVKMRELVWARLRQLGIGRPVGLPTRDWVREQRDKLHQQQQQQRQPRPGGLPGWPLLRPPHTPLLAPPVVLTGDPRKFHRFLSVAGDFIEVGAQAGFAPRARARRPDLMLSTVGAVLRGRGSSFDTRIGGSGLLLVGDVGADGSAGLPWPWPDPAYGDAAALVVEEEEEGGEGGAWSDGDEEGGGS